MKKPVLGLVLGGVLGALNGTTAMFSAPEVAPQIAMIVFLSMIKGLIIGVLIGFFAHKVSNLVAGLIFGLVVAALVTLPIAMGEDPNTHQVYFWEIMIPGSIVGLIVGYLTQKYGQGGKAKAALLLAFLVLPAATASAQPATLKSRLDSPAKLVSGFNTTDTTWSFSNMAPGWHVTAGPGVLLYDAAQSAAGQYSVDTYMHLFPNPPANGIGVFVGGQNIESDSPSYWLFEIRRDGMYRIAQRASGTERVVRGWTADPAIVKHPGGDTTVANRVRVMVRPDSIVMIVNTKPIAAVARAGNAMGGNFGLRVGPKVNVHVTHLDLIHHLAPIR